MLRKFIICLIFVFFLGRLSSADNIFDIKARIKAILEGQFTQLLGKTVKIESLEGNLYKKITLNNVSIAKSTKLEEGVFAYADKIEIQYDLKDILFSKFELLPNLQEIKIYEPYISIERDLGGNWNLLQTKSNLPNTQPIANIIANLKIYIIHGKGHFTDSRGWGKKPLAAKFETELQDINATLGLRNENLSVDIQSQVPGEKKFNQVNIRGNLDLITEAFKLKLQTKELNLKNFAYFNLAAEDFVLNKGQADLDLNVKSKGTLAQNLLNKLDLTAVITLRDTEIFLPRLMRYPLQKINSVISIANRQIKIKSARAWLDKKEITIQGTVSEYEQKFPAVNLTLTAKQISLQKLPDYFTTLKLNPPLKGTANLTMQLDGRLNAPEAKGQLFSQETYFQNIPLQNIQVNFAYLKEQLHLTLVDQGIFDGSVSGNLEVQVTKESTSVKEGRVQFHNLDSQKIANSRLVTGNLSGFISLSGPLKELNVSLNAFGQLLAYDQKINSLQTNLLFQDNKKLTIEHLNTNLNDRDFALNGSIEGSVFQINVPNQQLRLKKEELLKNIDSVCDMYVTVNGYLSGDLKNIPQSLKAQAEINIGPSIVLSESLRTSNLLLSLNEGLLAVRQADFNLANSNIKYNLTYKFSQNEFNLSIDKLSKISLGDLLFFQKYFPESSGILNIGGEIKYLDNKLQLDTQLNLNDFKYSGIILDKATIDFAYTNGQYNLRDYQLNIGKDTFRGKGYLAQDKTSTSNLGLANSLARLNLETESADLGKLTTLFNKLRLQYQAIQTRLKEASRENTSSLSLQPVEITDLNLPLYSEIDDHSVLNEYQKASQYTQQQVTVDYTSNINGILKGKLSFENDHGNLKIVSGLEIQQGNLAEKKFDLLRLNIYTEADVVYLESYFKNLALTRGVVYDEVNTQAEISSGNLYVKKFELKKKNVVSRDLLTGYFPLYALWDKTYAAKPLDLRFKITGDDLSLLSVYVRPINYIKNDGEIIFDLHGNFNQPLLDSEKIDLKNFRMKIDNSYYQTVLINRADLQVTGNSLEIGNLEILLSNETDETPIFKLAGTVGFKNWSLAKVDSLTLQNRLILKDVAGSLNLKNIYNGDFTLKNVSLLGDLNIPLSETEKDKAKQKIQANAESGPLLTGSLAISNGTIYLWKLEKDINLKSDKYLSLLLDIDFKIKNDVRVLSKESILTGDFSNLMNQINIGLRDENPEIKVAGSLNYLKVNGRIYFEDGYVGIINRKFMLLDKTDQEKYFGAAEQKVKDNYMELKESDKFTLDPQFFLVAQTTVYETVVPTNNQAGIGNTVNATPAAEYLLEKDYLVLIDGSIFDLSSISFERYTKQGSNYILDGEPYVLQDKSTGKMIDSARFQELTYDIAPQVFKSAYAMLSGTQEASTAGLTKEVARDLTVTEINLLMRSVLKPIERNIAKQTGLYDLKIKRDVGQDAAKALNLNDQRVLQTQEALSVDHVVGLEMIKELSRDRVFFSVDTSVDRNLQSEQLNFMVYSYKLTWKILRDIFLDEISLNYGNELDIYQKQYIPVMSLEGLHSF